LAVAVHVVQSRAVRGLVKFDFWTNAAPNLELDRVQILNLTVAATHPDSLATPTSRDPDPKRRSLMSITQDWTAHAGEGPARYQRLLAPAVFEPFARKLVSHARVRPGMNILDLACGTGAVSRAAARATGPHGSILAVDISPTMLSVAATCTRD